MKHLLKVAFLTLVLLTMFSAHSTREKTLKTSLNKEDIVIKKDDNQLCYYNKELKKTCHKFSSNLNITLPRNGTSGGGCGGSSQCGNNNYEIEWLKQYKKLNPNTFNKNGLNSKLQQLENKLKLPVNNINKK